MFVLSLGVHKDIFMKKIMNVSRKFWNTWFIKSIKAASALVSLKDITVNS